MAAQAIRPPNENRGDGAIAFYWTLSSIASIVIAARFYARWLISGIRADDWMVLLSLVLLLVTSGLGTHLSLLGGFRHLAHVPPENAQDVAMFSLLVQVFNICGFGTSKFAVGYQLLRVMEGTSKYRKAVVWVLMCVSLLLNTIEAVLTMFQCQPAEAAWDMSVKGECWSGRTKLSNIYVGGAFNVFADVAFALLPLPTIWSLQISMKTRIRLCLLLSLGLFAAVSGSVKLSYAYVIGDPQNITWVMYDLDAWSAAELFVIIVCASVPPLHVLWKQNNVKRSLTSSGNKSRRSLAHPLKVVSPPLRSHSREDDEARLWTTTDEGSARENRLGRIRAVTDISVSTSEGREEELRGRNNVLQNF